MSSQVITRALGGNAPQTYELAANETLEPTAIYAHFDGSGAGGAFRPCVSYYTQDGHLFARAFPTDTVAAGASASVAYFPGLSQSSRPSGIFFDTKNTGDWLDITVNGADSFGNGITLQGTAIEIDNDVLFNGTDVSAVLAGDFEVTTALWIVLNGEYAELVPATTPSWQTTTHTSGVLRLGDQHSDVQIGDDLSGAGGATLTVHASTVQIGNSTGSVVLLGALSYLDTDTVTLGNVGSSVQVGGNTTVLNLAKIGFYGVAPATRQTVTGSKGGNAALASLLTALATLGLIIDNST